MEDSTFLKLHQLFIRSLMNPLGLAQIDRLLLLHRTGSGKTLTAAGVAKHYLELFKSIPQQKTSHIVLSNEYLFSERGGESDTAAAAAVVPELAEETIEDIQERARMEKDVIMTKELEVQDDDDGIAVKKDMPEVNSFVTILGFTRDNIKTDMLQFPFLGFITPEERAYLDEHPQELPKFKKRITNTKELRFFGLTEFVNRMIISGGGAHERVMATSTLSPEEFARQVDMGNIKLNAQFIESFRNTLLIIDEAHNAYNSDGLNKFGVALAYMLDYLKSDIKVMFMTATPFNNTIQEVYHLGRLLNYNNDNGNNSKIIINTDVKEYLKQSYSDKVSYYYIGGEFGQTGDDTRPKVIYNGSTNKLIPTLPLVRCKVFNQNELLKLVKITDNNRVFFANRKHEYDLDVAWPVPFDQAAAIKELTKSPDSLEKVSAKHKKALDILIEGLKVGKSFVYHKFIKEGGVRFIEWILINIGGFVHWKADKMTKNRPEVRCAICSKLNKDHRTTDHDFTPATYAVITGEISIPERENIKAIYNSDWNARGLIINTLIGSQVLEESTTLKAVRNMLILSNPINLSIMQQIIGRGDRTYSHHQLKPEERTVTISLLINSFDDHHQTLSPEESYYYQNYIVHREINEAIDIIKTIAIDRDLYGSGSSLLFPFEKYESNDLIEELLRLIKLYIKSNVVVTDNDLVPSLIKLSTKYNIKMVDDVVLKYLFHRTLEVNKAVKLDEGVYCLNDSNLDEVLDNITNSGDHFTVLETRSEIRKINNQNIINLSEWMKPFEKQWTKEFIQLTVNISKMKKSTTVIEKMELLFEDTGNIKARLLALAAMNKLITPINKSLIIPLYTYKDNQPIAQPYLGILIKDNLTFNILDVLNVRSSTGLRCKSILKEKMEEILVEHVAPALPPAEKNYLQNQLKNFKQRRKNVCTLALAAFASAHINSKQNWINVILLTN